MYWLMMRPLVGWTAFVLVHAIGISLVYGLGKARGMKQAQDSHSMLNCIPKTEE